MPENCEGYMEHYKPVDVKDFYNEIHNQYYDPKAHEVTCYVKELHEKIMKEFRESLEGPMLDVGCASQAPLSNSIGCDISLEGLRVRRRSYPGDKSVCADIISLPFMEGAFAGIFAGLMIDHIEDTLQAFLSLKEVSIPGGRLVMTLFDSSKRPSGKYGDNQLRYKSTNGKAYAVPSYGWTREYLESSASQAGWTLSPKVITYDTPDPEYRLLQLDFKMGN